jgi:uncharacterized protein (TIGR03083 family)
MYLSTAQCLEAIESHTRALAAAAEGNLDARIEHCPEWSMGDLVWHLTDVHWFWNHVATERPSTAPEDPTRPERPDDEELVGGLVRGMEVLVANLGAADQDAPCWTWGLEEKVAFITRHQVQEAAVHHWDAVNALGRPQDWFIRPDDAIDAVEEFLTHSVANRRWPEPDAEPMRGTIWFCPCYADTGLCPAWYVTDGEQTGTVVVRTDVEDEQKGHVFGSHGEPADLLLWLYRRVPTARAFLDEDPSPSDEALLERFRALTSTS